MDGLQTTEKIGDAVLQKWCRKNYQSHDPETMMCTFAADQKNVCEQYSNTKINVDFINYSYKCSVHETLQDKMKGIEELEEKRDNHFEMYGVDDHIDDEINQDIKETLNEFMGELQCVIDHLARTEEDFYQCRDVKFQSDGLLATLKYGGDQTKHHDTQEVMDLQSGDRGDCTLVLINIMVNEKGIRVKDIGSGDPGTMIFEMVPRDKEKVKHLCFNNLGTPCYEGAQRGKHLICRRGTVIVGFPPSVALRAHQAHSVESDTMVFTARGLSGKRRRNAMMVNDLIEEIERYRL